MRDVVVCLPGITGSVLQKDGRDVWNISGGALISALTTLGRSIQEEAELGPLSEGAYRLAVFGTGAVDPVTDLVTVLEE